MASIRSTKLSHRALTLGLAFWGCGCLSLEALAIAGQVLTALALAVLLWPQRREWRSVLREWAPLWVALIGFIVFPLLGGVLPTGTGWARWADWISLPIAAAAVMRIDSDALRKIAISVGVVWALSCVLAAMQHLGWWPELETLRPLEKLGFGVGRVYEPVPGADHRFMAGGLSFHRLKFAHVGAFAVLWSAAIAFRTRGGAQRMAVALALLGFVSVAIFPHARAAAFALVIALAVLIYRSLPQRIGILAASGVVILGVLVAIASPSVRQRLLSSFSSAGSGDRAAILNVGVQVVREHPLTGVGLGHFSLKRFADASAPVHVREHPGKAHNHYLSFAAETGLVGALLWVVFLGWLAWKFWTWRSSGAPGLGMLTFFTLLGMTHDPLFHAPFSLATMLSLGAAWGLCRRWLPTAPSSVAA